MSEVPMYSVQCKFRSATVCTVTASAGPHLGVDGRPRYLRQHPQGSHPHRTISTLFPHSPPTLVPHSLQLKVNNPPLSQILGMSEFLDGDQLTNLEAALVRLGAKECVVAEDKMRAPVESKKIREVFATASPK